MQNLYTKKFIKLISIFAIIASLLLAVRTVERIWDLIKNPEDYELMSIKLLIKSYFLIVENIIFIVLYIFLIFNPQRFIIIGITALFYSIDNLLSSVQLPYMGVPMFTLCIGTFAFRGFFNTHKKIKIGIFAFIYIVSLFLPIFYDPEFVEHITSKIAITLVTILSMFFFSEYTKQVGKNQATKDKVLNLAEFKGLDRSDMYLLQQVLDNVKYKEIAQKIHGSEGALRNKLSKIYKTLEVGDRTGFLSIYSGYELLYEPEAVNQTAN